MYSKLIENALLRVEELDDELCELAWERERAIIEWNSQLNYAKESGMKIGHEKGKEEGREEGRLEERAIVFYDKLERGKKMLAKGMSIEDVSEFSGLSLKEIEENLL